MTSVQSILLPVFDVCCFHVQNSFGILNQLEKNDKMWRFLSGCKLPPMKKTKNNEDGQEFNRNYGKKKRTCQNSWR